MEPAAVALRGSRHLSVTPLEKQASGKARLPDRRRQRQVTGCNSPWPERHRAPPGPPRTCQEQIAKLTRFPFALLVRRLGHRSDSGAQTAENLPEDLRVSLRTEGDLAWAQATSYLLVSCAQSGITADLEQSLLMWALTVEVGVEDDQACDHLPASAMLHLHSGGRRAGSAEWAEALSPSLGRGALLVHQASEPPLSAGRCPREKSDHWTHFTDENSRSGELGNVPGSHGQCISLQPMVFLCVMSCTWVQNADC